MIKIYISNDMIEVVATNLHIEHTQPTSNSKYPYGIILFIYPIETWHLFVRPSYLHCSIKYELQKI